MDSNLEQSSTQHFPNEVIVKILNNLENNNGELPLYLRLISRDINQEVLSKLTANNRLHDIKQNNLIELITKNPFFRVKPSYLLGLGDYYLGKNGQIINKPVIYFKKDAVFIKTADDRKIEFALSMEFNQRFKKRVLTLSKIERNDARTITSQEFIPYGKEKETLDEYLDFDLAPNVPLSKQSQVWLGGFWLDFRISFAIMMPLINAFERANEDSWLGTFLTVMMPFTVMFGTVIVGCLFTAVVVAEFAIKLAISVPCLLFSAAAKVVEGIASVVKKFTSRKSTPVVANDNAEEGRTPLLPQTQKNYGSNVIPAYPNPCGFEKALCPRGSKPLDNKAEVEPAVTPLPLSGRG